MIGAEFHPKGRNTMNKTLTPLFDAIEALLRRQDFSRFHTPGHKGSALGFLSAVTPWDFTEVRGADSLFEADGPISETERLYTGFCGTAGSFLSAGGSTLCIQAMLRLVQPLGQKILIGRNAHGSAVSAMALLGLTPVWLCPETGTDLLPAPITPAQAEAALARHPDAAAVYVTSPDYFGKLTDIAGLSEVCRRYGVPLLVDNAHGAELFFTDGARHPMQLGADLCCDSLHKTLPVLTGGAMLHVGDTALARKSGFAASAKEAMHLFGSTSPSYLVMLSMDTLLPSLYDGTLRREVGEQRQGGHAPLWFHQPQLSGDALDGHPAPQPVRRHPPPGGRRNCRPGRRSAEPGSRLRLPLARRRNAPHPAHPDLFGAGLHPAGV